MQSPYTLYRLTCPTCVCIWLMSAEHLAVGLGASKSQPDSSCFLRPGETNEVPSRNVVSYFQRSGPHTPTSLPEQPLPTAMPLSGAPVYVPFAVAARMASASVGT